MIRTFSKSVSLRFCTVVEVKSKFGAEFRRFSLDRYEPGMFKDFLQLLLSLHNLRHVEIFICYADVHGELLPINNDENFCKAVSTAQPLLRIFIQQQEEIDQASARTDGVKRQKKSAAASHGDDPSRRRPQVQISMPQNFRPISSIIDVDILPECHRRVRLYSQGSDRPLGFYIRDGTTVRVTSHGLEKVPGIFISRMVPGGLAQSTGLLAINDQVLEVNGIDVMGKSLDQVTDMMVANSYNLIITVKPANQRNNAKRFSYISPSPGRLLEGKGSISYPGLPMIMGAHIWTSNSYESDEDSDLIVDRPVKHPSQRSNASGTPQSSRSSAHDRYRCLGHHCSPDYCRSQPSLNHMSPPEPSTPLHREMIHQHHYRSSPAFRQSTSSTQDILSMLRADVRQRLMLPQGAMEEDGIVITL
ncbi:par-6 family cell polarity regulator gamma a [Salminus brasiliensis]|uniref:par-6 family cell polarity regulator gamma a n=1 Tax=Salminus brasiliensis TaxID=930266 RepID=UPI003B82D145